MRDIQTSIEQPFDYSAVIFANPVGAGTRQTIGKSEGQIIKSDFVDLEIVDLHLSPGAYHLESFVRLTLPGATRAQMQDLMAMTESGVIHVY